jgi:hypothetical protein
MKRPYGQSRKPENVAAAEAAAGPAEALELDLAALDDDQ